MVLTIQDDSMKTVLFPISCIQLLHAITVYYSQPSARNLYETADCRPASYSSSCNVSISWCCSQNGQDCEPLEQQSSETMNLYYSEK